MLRALTMSLAVATKLTSLRTASASACWKGPARALPAVAAFRGPSCNFNPPQSAMSTRAYTYQPLSSYSESEAVIEEVDFDPALANSISLIGTTGRDIELKFLQSGNKVASVGIAVKDRKGGQSEWFEVELWGPLAERASETVKKGTQVAVQGRLKVDSWQDKSTGQTRKAYKVVANSLKRVRAWRGGAEQQQAPAFPQENQQQQQQQGVPDWPPPPAAAAAPAPAGAAALTTNEELWMSYFENPGEWDDFRPQKASGQVKSTFPDFKRRGEGRANQPALWVDSRQTPAWVKGELQKLDAQRGGGPPF